jgi:Histidine phosphatase superfamily (branch 1)
VAGLVCVLAAVVGTGAIFGLSEKSRSDDHRLGRELQRGGLIVLLRHGPRRHVCSGGTGLRWSGHLTSEGRADARAMGAGFAGADVPVHSLLVSPLCRAQDTARLAFSAVSASVVTALALNAYDGANARDRKLREVRQLLSQRPPPGTDRVLITQSSRC